MPYEILNGRTPMGDNDLRTLPLFHEREYYKEFANSASSGMIDLLNDRPEYGRIDRAGHYVIPNESFLMPLKQGESIYAMNFVTAAYNDFYEYIQKKIRQRKVYREGFLVDLKPKRGWVSVTNLYHEHLNRTYKTFIRIINSDLSNKKDITDFSNFQLELFSFLREAREDVFFSFNKFIRSNLNPPNTTGLIIDHEIKNFSKDQKKVSWLRDRNFPMYVKAAKSHGFLVDKNSPWRLVFNVTSEKGKEYQKNFMPKFERLFDLLYTDIRIIGVNLFKSYLNSYYNSFVNVNSIQTYPKLKSNNKTCIRNVKRNNVNIEEEKEIYKAYLRLRLIEESKEENVSNLDKHVINAITFNERRPAEAGSRYLDFVIRNS